MANAEWEPSDLELQTRRGLGSYDSARGLFSTVTTRYLLGYPTDAFRSRRMFGPIRRVACPTILLSLTVARAGAAQDTFVSLGVGTFVGGGRGITNHCHEHSTRTGVSLTVGRRVWGDLLAVQAHLGLHAFREGPACAVLIEPPLDGTYTHLDRVNLLESRFAATDLRVRVGAGAGGLRGALTLGGGMAWRTGRDLPYAAVGVNVAAPLGPFWFVADGDLYHMRVRFDIVERTYADWELVTAVPLGTASEWNWAGRILVGLLVPVGSMR